MTQETQTQTGVQTDMQAPAGEMSVSLSQSAARRIAALIAADETKGEGTCLRISVTGGGCQGFQYGFALDDSKNDDDHTFTRDEASIRMDEMSLGLLTGSEIDYVEDMMGSYFRINNPNASSTCGCGGSFSV